MIKAIIFDCFGVLYRNASNKFFEGHKDLFKGNSTKLDELNLQIDLGEVSRIEFFQHIEKTIGFPADKIKAEFDEDLSLPDQNLIEFIKKLKPHYKVGLLSNAGKEEIEIIYRDKIDGLFDDIVVSYKIQKVKPYPEIFLIAAEQLGVQPAECIFVDDSIRNLEAAAKLGMKTILYPEFGSIPSELQSCLTATAPEV